MGTPASLLDLIARGGPMEVGRVNQMRDAEMATRAAQAKQAEAAALENQAQTAKVEQEIQARKIAMADQGAISEAYKATGGDPAKMRDFLKPRLSGGGLMEWQKHEIALRENAEKLKEHELKTEAITNDRAGQMLSAVAADKDPAAAYAMLHPTLSKLVPGLPPPDKFSPDSIPLLMGAIGHNKAVLEEAKAKADIAHVNQQTSSSRQKADLEERAAFLQGVRPDMPYAEYKALPGYDKFAKVYPSPAAAAAAAKVEGIAVKDRTKAEQDARVLAGMSPTGITAEQQARMDQDKAEAEQRARQHRESIGVQMRGQNMANDRALEAREARPVTEAEAKTYGYYKRMNDAEQTITSMAGKMAEKGLFGQTAMKYAPNWLQSEDNQVFEQASRQFTEARLRRDSGAAIPTHEYENDKRIYFPQPGDTPETQRRKDKARAVVLETMRKESGRAIERFDGVKVGTTPTSSDPNIEQLQKQFPGAKITRVP